jgi:hypothetical protein
MTMGAEGTISCRLDLKNSRKVFRMSALVIITANYIDFCSVNLIFAFVRVDFESAKVLNSARILIGRQSPVSDHEEN